MSTSQLPDVLHFEDFNSRDFQLESPTRRVTKDEITTFADLSGDHNPIHTDPAIGAGLGLKGIPAQGVLTLSIATGLAWQTELASKCKAVMLQRVAWQFKRVVLAGDELHLIMTLASITSHRGQYGEVSFSVCLYNQHNKCVGEGTWVFLIPKRDPTS